jgi:hypothetical protein
VSHIEGPEFDSGTEYENDIVQYRIGHYRGQHIARGGGTFVFEFCIIARDFSHKSAHPIKTGFLCPLPALATG